MDEQVYLLEIPAETDKLNDVLAFIEEHLEENDCPMRAQMQLSIASEEIFVNIAHYAYAPGSGTAEIRLALSGEPRQARITFMDSGAPFDPLAREDPDVTLSAEDRSVGGLGIYMTKKTMDDMQYEYRDGQNRLTLIKNL